MKFIINILVSALAVLISAWLLPGVHITDYGSALLVAVVLAFLNAVVKPILTILTIPITFFTLGFFLLVINALMIILASKIIPEFHVNGFWWALIFSLILSLVTGILNMFVGNTDKEE
ncbi:MAG TPA: phage holin family protein [Bacteroidia bacterium]|jgi:putative membrane protein|nr:phage holin family protein [Bacteroidia bacterium]